MLTPEQLHDATNYIAGSCQMVCTAVSAVTNEVFTQEDEDQLENHLVAEECYCCDTCGWWNHPGEGDCACQDGEED